MNVLIVEDEIRVAEFIQRGLKSEGWSVTVAPDGETGLDLLQQDQFDVIILDLVLPGINGQDLCRHLRNRQDMTPILMLSALGKIDDRVAGLRTGADDYLAKPFDFDELLARLEALARRASGFPKGDSPSHVVAAGPLSFDTNALEVRCEGRLIDLSTKEREILALLMTNPSKVHSRERILNAVWQMQKDPLTNVVDVYIGRIRKKLGPCGDLISTVRGAGYRLCPKDEH